MGSLTRWMWIWVNSGSWWWTGRPGMLRFMGSQRVGHDWATELKTYFVLSTCHTCCTFLSFFFLPYFEFTEYFSYSNVVPSNVAPWKESYGKPRQCDIILTTKVRRVKGVDFLVVMYRCESCTIKKAECQKIDAFELWCWGKLLRVLWIARRSNQSILKESSPEYSLEEWCWSSNTLATWSKNPLIGKEPEAGKDWRQVEKKTTENEMAGWYLTEWTWVWASSRKQWRTGKPGVLQSMGLQRVRHDWATEQQQRTFKKLVEESSNSRNKD